VVKTSRMRDALSTLNRSLQKAARREERDLLLKNTIFPVTVNLTKLVSMIKTQLEALKESQARMETRIEEQENDLERAEARINEQENDLERAEARINEQDTKIEKLEMAGVFTYISTLASNDAAEAECVKQGGHLASLDTNAKIEYAKEHLIPKDNTKGVVICNKITDRKYSGYDIKKFYDISSVEECQNICIGLYPECVGYTWVKPYSHCFPKTQLAREEKYKNRYSGRCWIPGKVWLGADCVGCKVAHEDNWQWKSGSKIKLDDPLWGHENGHDLPYDADNDDATHLAMRCRDGDCEFINHNWFQTLPYICEKSSGRK